MDVTESWWRGPDGSIRRLELSGLAVADLTVEGWERLSALEAAQAAAEVFRERSENEAAQRSAQRDLRASVRDELTALGLSDRAAVFLSGWTPE